MNLRNSAGQVGRAFRRAGSSGLGVPVWKAWPRPPSGSRPDGIARTGPGSGAHRRRTTALCRRGLPSPDRTSGRPSCASHPVRGMGRPDRPDKSGRPASPQQTVDRGVGRAPRWHHRRRSCPPDLPPTSVIRNVREAHPMDPSIPRPTDRQGSPSESRPRRDTTDFGPIPGAAEAGAEEIPDRDLPVALVEPRADRSAPAGTHRPALAADLRSAERRDAGQTGPRGRGLAILTSRSPPMARRSRPSRSTGAWPCGMPCGV